MPLWRLRSPKPIVSKLETQASQWYSSSSVQRPGNQESQQCKLQLKTESMTRDQHPNLRTARQREFSLSLLFHSGLQQTE